MLTLPETYCTLISRFAHIFSQRVWHHAQVLLIGAILAPGKRTVTSVLRVMGLSEDQHFENYHRVLSRAVWSSLEASRILLMLLVNTLVPRGPVVMGIDETIERRRGAKIKAKGIYRDAVRSSRSHLVKASGLRWLSMMLLVPIPWAKRVWALPFLTALAPSARYYEGKARGHKKLTDWARQMLLQVRRWVPERALVVVADSSYAAILLLERLRRLPNPICMVTRLRLDAALYEPAPPRQPGKRGRPRVKGARLPSLKQILGDPKTVWKKVTIRDWYGGKRRQIQIVSRTAVWYHSGMPPLPIRWVLIRDPKGMFRSQALLCTDLTVDPVQIVKWFVMRWQLEVTFREVRTHLGVETQRQWSDWAIARTYAKPLPTFSDALAVVRYHLWQAMSFHPSVCEADMQEVPRVLLKRFTDALCYASRR